MITQLPNEILHCIVQYLNNKDMEQLLMTTKMIRYMLNQVGSEIDAEIIGVSPFLIPEKYFVLHLDNDKFIRPIKNLYPNIRLKTNYHSLKPFDPIYEKDIPLLYSIDLYHYRIYYEQFRKYEKTVKLLRATYLSLEEYDENHVNNDVRLVLEGLNNETLTFKKGNTKNTLVLRQCSNINIYGWYGTIKLYAKSNNIIIHNDTNKLRICNSHDIVYDYDANELYIYSSNNITCNGHVKKQCNIDKGRNVKVNTIKSVCLFESNYVYINRAINVRTRVDNRCHLVSKNINIKSIDNVYNTNCYNINGIVKWPKYYEFYDCYFDTELTIDNGHIFKNNEYIHGFKLHDGSAFPMYGEHYVNGKTVCNYYYTRDICLEFINCPYFETCNIVMCSVLIDNCTKLKKVELSDYDGLSCNTISNCTALEEVICDGSLSIKSCPALKHITCTIKKLNIMHCPNIETLTLYRDPYDENEYSKISNLKLPKLRAIYIYLYGVPLECIPQGVKIYIHSDYIDEYDVDKHTIHIFFQ